MLTNSSPTVSNFGCRTLMVFEGAGFQARDIEDQT